MAKDWLNNYGTPSNGVRKFQEGGAMAPAPGPEQGAPAPEQGGGQDIEAMLAEYAQSKDPQLAVAICDMLVEMMAQGGGGGEAAPAGPEGGAPMARNGMKLRRGPVFSK